MNNIPIFGIENSYTPLSDAFCVDIINETISLDKEISSIIKMSLSIDSEYVDEFSVVDNFFTNILLSINVKVDYLCNLNKINYHIFDVQKLLNICSSTYKCNKNTPVYTQIIDAGITDIKSNSISLYIVPVCSLNI